MVTKVKRSIFLTLAMLGVSLFLASLSSMIYDDYAGFGKSSGFFGWLGFLATAALSLLGVLGAIFVAGRAPCPHCKDTLSVLDLYSDIECGACPSCKNFYEIKKHEIMPIEETRLAEKPIFPLPMPEGKLDWPKVCAVCDKKSTRTIDVNNEIKPTNEPLPFGLKMAAVLGFDQSRMTDIPLHFLVPHCNEHDDGVELEAGSYPRLKFRSLVYRQKFRLLSEKKK
jgi:hypothetical protein